MCGDGADGAGDGGGGGSDSGSGSGSGGAGCFIFRGLGILSGLQEERLRVRQATVQVPTFGGKGVTQRAGGVFESSVESVR